MGKGKAPLVISKESMVSIVGIVCGKRVSQIRVLVTYIRRSSLAQEAIWAVFLRVFYAGFTFLSTVFLARFLGAANYGVYAFAFSLVVLLSTPIHSGIADLVLRETVYGLTQNRPDYVKGVWYWAHQIVLFFSLLIIGIGCLLIWWRGGVGSVTGWMFIVTLLLVPFFSLVNIYGYILRGLQYTVLGLIPDFFVRPGVFWILIVLAIYIFKQKLTPFYAILLQLIAVIISIVIAIWFLNKYTPHNIKVIKSYIKEKKWIKSGLFFGLLSVLGVINNQSSIIILGLLDSPKSVGYYRVAVQMANLTILGLQSVSLVITPRFADLWSKGDNSQLQKLVTWSSRVIFIFNMIVVIIFLLVGRSLLHFVFGEEFNESYIPLVILLCGQVINSSTGAVWFLLNMTGYERKIVMVMGVTSLISILLGLFFIPLWGVVGASVATSLSLFIWNVWLSFISYKKIGINSFIINVKVLK